MNMNMNKFAVIDFETTGLSPKAGSRVIEVGIVLIENDRVVNEFQSLINPGIMVPDNITSLTSINNSMIKAAPSPRDVFPKVIEFIGDSVLIAHNANFDKLFFVDELRRIGKVSNPDFICTLLLSRRIYPWAENHKLITLVDIWDIHISGDFHRALSDAKMTAELFIKIRHDLKTLYDDLITPSFLIRYQKTTKSKLKNIQKNKQIKNKAKPIKTKLTTQEPKINRLKSVDLERRISNDTPYAATVTPDITGREKFWVNELKCSHKEDKVNKKGILEHKYQLLDNEALRKKLKKIQTELKNIEEKTINLQFEKFKPLMMKNRIRITLKTVFWVTLIGGVSFQSLSAALILSGISAVFVFPCSDGWPSIKMSKAALAERQACRDQILRKNDLEYLVNRLSPGHIDALGFTVAEKGEFEIIDSHQIKENRTGKIFKKNKDAVGVHIYTFIIPIKKVINHYIDFDVRET